MNSNPLNDILPDPVRRYVYAAYVVAGLVIGALAVAGVDVGKAPDVMTYLAIPLGALAASNTNSQSPPQIIDGDPDDLIGDDYMDEDDYEGEPDLYGTQPPLHRPGSDAEGFGGDAPLPGPENGSHRL